MPDTLIPSPSRRSSQATPTRAAACTAVVGLQWGDEGKGKAVDLLTPRHDAVIRYNGGANAGHSVVVKGERYALHLIPSGILYPGKPSVVGNGVVLDPEKIIQEIEGLTTRGVDVSGLVISDRAHVVLPYHHAEDAMREELLKRRTSGTGSAEIGTTRRGIGPAYADKVQRGSAVRVGDLLKPDVLREKIELGCTLKNPSFAAAGMPSFDSAELTARAEAAGRRLAPMVKDTTYLLHDLLGQGKSLLFEGANGTLLDVDHGTYPYVTSSNTGTAGIPPGTGVPASNLGKIIGVMKAYSTRVGTGPLPTELHDALGQRIRDRGREYGTTTGRPRRVGWLDLVAVKYAAMVNGATDLSLMLLDVLSGLDGLRVCTAYRINGKDTARFVPDAGELSRVEPVFTELPGFAEDIAKAERFETLPDNCRRYVEFIERHVGLPASIVSIGPGREQTILR